MKVRKLGIYAAGAAFALAVSAAPPALSQTVPEGAPEEMPRPGEAPAQSFSEAELRAYADATVRLQEINRDYAGRLEQAPDAEAEQEIRQEGQREMAEAVEDAGISVQRFSEISRFVQEDPEVREKVQRYMDERD